MLEYLRPEYLKYATPFLAALTGWVTNYFAIKMLFRPRVEKNLFLFKLHGVFPKRQEELGYRLGRVVSRELFSMDEIKDKIDNEEVRAQVKTAILKELENYLVEYTKSNKLVAMFVNDKMLDNLKGKVSEGLDEMIPKMLGQFSGKLEEIDVETIVATKIHNFSHDRLEQLLMSIIRKELKLIEVLGGVLGFFVGLLQLGLFTLLVSLMFVTPILAALIGWVTNYFAIKMLFRPRIEKNFYLFKLHGVFPKRQEELGYRLGKVVSKELFSIDEIKDKIDNEEVRGELKVAIIQELETYLVEYTKTNKLVAMFVNEKMLENLKGKVSEGLDEMIPKMLGQFSGKLEGIDVETIIAKKIHNFSHERLEQLLMSIIQKELKTIEILGAVLGFFVGLIQLGIFML